MGTSKSECEGKDDPLRFNAAKYCIAKGRSPDYPEEDIMVIWLRNILSRFNK